MSDASLLFGEEATNSLVTEMDERMKTLDEKRRKEGELRTA